MKVRGAALAICLALVGVARADERATAREHYFKGTKAFDLGLYEEAITEYQAAYKAKDDPALLYNIAQAHRLAGHAPEALRFYKVYLSKLPHAANRPEVEVKIAELEKLVEQQKKTTRELPPDQVKPIELTPRSEAPPPTEPVPTPETRSPPPPAEAPPPAIDRSAGRTKKIAGFAVAGVGVALLAAGAGLTAVAKQDESDLAVQYDPGKESAGKTFATVGPVLLGVGAAAAVAGVVVAALGFRDAKAARVALRPVLGPRIAGASLGLSF
jgi:tetratricopeptide (TPR) repeat protein